MIPVLVGGFNVIELFLTAISYSLYAFEYKWMNMGKWGGQSALRLCVCGEDHSADIRLSACVSVCLC